MSQTVLDRPDAGVTDVRAYFERAADSFDRLYSEDGQGPFWRWVNSRFRSDIIARFLRTCEHVKQARARSVLDVGCGSGRYLAAFAQLGVERLAGIDISAPMLDLARRHLATAGRVDVELICGNFDEYATNQRFDVVVAMGFFDYQADPVAVLARMRALARHSVIASFPSRHWFRTPLRQARYRIKKCPVYFYDPRRIMDIAEQAGYAYAETVKLPGAGMDYVTTLRVGVPFRNEVAHTRRAGVHREILAGALPVA